MPIVGMENWRIVGAEHLKDGLATVWYCLACKTVAAMPLKEEELDLENVVKAEEEHSHMTDCDTPTIIVLRYWVVLGITCLEREALRMMATSR